MRPAIGSDGRGGVERLRIGWAALLSRPSIGRRGASFGALALFALALQAAAPETSVPAWPDTEAGKRARGWVEAFAAGEPAMRRFYSESFSAASLAEKSAEARLESYRKLRELLGTLELVRVDEERGAALDVSLVDAHGAEHEFTFEIEEQEPWKLVRLTAKIRQAGHGGFPH